MDQQAIARLSMKNNWQTLPMELLNYRLSPIEAQAVTHRIRHYLDEHNPDRLDEGQIFYSAVAFSEPASKPVKECQLVRIKLTLCAPEDLDYLVVGRGGVPELRRARLFRLACEAVDQGALLTQEDLVQLLGISRRTVIRIVEEYRKQGIFIPTRGYCKDMGRGTTHKTVAIKMYLEYASYTEMERKTDDTSSSLMRYVKDFAAVVNAVDAGLSPDQVRVVTGMSKKLVSEYIDLYHRYDTEEHQDILDRIRHPLVTPEQTEKGGQR
jgi:DNA-binding Lrp family transcriptional regulator